MLTGQPREVDFSKEPQELENALKSLLREDPALWVSRDKYLRVLSDTKAALEERGFKFQYWIELTIAMRKQLDLPVNVRLLKQAIEAHFKYGKQKMKLRQELKDSPLRDIDLKTLLIALTRLVSGDMTPEKVEKLKANWQQDPQHFFDLYI